MCDFDKFASVLDELAPLSLSRAMIEKGDYDNSGTLVKCHDHAESALFSLDLSIASLNAAIKNKCDVIVTHHPAIYAPIKSLSCEDGTTAPLLGAIKKNINVVSMHLNLDVADGGIDASLCEGLGGKSYRILDPTTELNGYGREFAVAPITLSKFVANLKREFSTQKVTVYGKRAALIKKVASFCGGGSSIAQRLVAEGVTDADLIVTSDMAHHQIKELVEKGKNIVLIPHYVAEEYGFKKYYQRVTEKVSGKTRTYYFDDKRFR